MEFVPLPLSFSPFPLIHPRHGAACFASLHPASQEAKGPAQIFPYLVASQKCSERAPTRCWHKEAILSILPATFPNSAAS